MIDERDSRNDALLSIQITNFLFRSAVGRQLTQIVETPLFVDSKITPGIQIADYFAGCIRQYHEIVDEGVPAEPTYRLAVQRLYKSISRTTFNQTDADGRTWYGDYSMPASKLEQLHQQMTSGTDASVVLLEEVDQSIAEHGGKEVEQRPNNAQ